MNEKAYLLFWGVRGSYAAPHKTHLKVGGNTSCVEFYADQHTLICDAGTGIISCGEEMINKKYDKKEVMVILTHYHWDHICGLPFFMPAFLSGWKIQFFGPGDTQAEVKKNLDSQMQAPYFPVDTESWIADITYIDPTLPNIAHGPFSIVYHNVHHPGLTYGYRISVYDKTIIYIPDNECRFLDKSIKQRWTEFSKEEQHMLKKMSQEEYESELNNIRGADILIHDAQYTLSDYKKKCGWGHSCYIDTVNTAIDAGVKSLYLYHYDPSYNDQMVAKIYEDCIKIIQQRNSPLQCHIATEGLTIDL